MEADVDQAELEQLQRAINHEMRERCTASAVKPSCCGRATIRRSSRDS
jgi:hypothetical protein